ncbi:MAG: chemotaxis protein CheW [Ignavibacteriales bacterium]|jgi:purine-binding chemotaxis protein CheW|nr:chemotaxis protein CheW [Ignavibacteriales bacterium]
MQDEDLRELDEEFEEEDSQKDKYLTFKIAGEEYAIEIKFVTEIIGIQKITEVPDMDEYVRGVINLRGKVIPVIDVRLRFHYDFLEYNDRTCIVVVEIEDRSVGLIVDEVSEVIDIPEANVDPPPRTSKGARGRYIQGMGKVDDQVKIILNIAKLLTEEERATLDEIAQD